MKKNAFISILLLILFASCKENEPTYTYQYNLNPQYTWGYAEFYGDYYGEYGIPNSILSLSLFSDSLGMTQNGNLVGVGQYLFLEDVLIQPTDTFLAEGIYTVSNSGEPFTVFPGKNDTIDTEVYPMGAMIVYLEEMSTLSTMKYIVDGTFAVSRQDSVYTIICDFTTADNKSLKGRFMGVLPHVDQSLPKQQQITPKRKGLRMKL